MPDDDVVVVGGGLAGLSCSYHLARRGLSVTLLEARARWGGRVITVRDWDGGMVAEGGAEFIDTNHRHVIRYVRGFGLELRPLDLWSHLPDEPPGVERFWESLHALSRLLPSARKVWPLPPRLAELDGVSVSEWCRRLELDEACCRELEIWCWGVEAASPEEVSVLGLILEERLRPPSAVQAGMTLRGGMDRLPQAFLQACRELGVQARSGVEVKGVRQTPGGVEIDTDGDLYRGGRAVIALPATVLRRLPLQPALSAAKREALRASTYGDLVKSLLEFRRRFWPHRENGPYVRLFGDELNSVWECTEHDSRAVLVLWTSGEWARRLAGFSEEERVEWALGALERRLPEARRYFVRGRSFDWSQDPYSQGAYSHFQVGFLTHHAQALSHPEGRLHFAGEHTSPFCGYMEGALESGVRAALEILKGA